MAIDTSSYLKIVTEFKYEATLWDGESTLEKVMDQHSPTSFTNADTPYQINAFVGMAIEHVAEQYLASGMEYEGWSLLEISVWPVHRAFQ
ncbi:MAG: hypothetical protein LC723_05765 [Actinobacteria bacterium]|nr:hypothetical protein [Actinomycetota bacterium]